MVDVSDEDADSVAAASEGGEGTVVKCSYTAIALSPDLKAQFASAQMVSSKWMVKKLPVVALLCMLHEHWLLFFLQSPIMPLRLLVPANYPKCSPVLLDNLPVEPR